MPNDRGGCVSRETIMDWLQRPNKDCLNRDIFLDPGYSAYYKRFTSVCDDGLLYRGSIDESVKTDLDFRLGLVHDCLIDGPIIRNNSQMGTLNEDIKDFVDCVPVDSSNSKYYQLLIPPGTNHSNANVLYKIIQNEILEETQNNPFFIADLMTKKYEGDFVKIDNWIDKRIIYRFCYENSAHPEKQHKR